MEKFDVNVYIEGCRLIIDVVNGTPDIYMVLFNTYTKELSDIVKWSGSFKYNMQTDGIYKLCILQDPNAQLSEEGVLTTNGYQLSAQDFVDAVGLSNTNILGRLKFDSEEIFCLCKLKKCLLELQKKIFQEMLKSCGSRSCKSNEYKSQRDFLFIGVWLLEHLAQDGKWEQVRNLFDSLQSCGSICDGLSKSKNCGCTG